MDTPDLLARLRSGDRQAFAALVVRYQRPLFGFLGRMGCAPALAEDLAQDAFVRAWQQLDRYRPEMGALSTWLFTIARHLAINELGRSHHVRERPAAEDAPEPACPRPQPPEVLALAQQRQRLHAALRQLSLADRSLLALAYVEELAMADIARIEGCSVAAAKTRLTRARQRLGRLLEPSDAY
ncbi:MAG TPA: sigma-70 family RNA polymerase sigma factor [Zoogloea sp.]|uniref:RNA polymerase sigma factor n=1 Tax=Zoogloea sp. TaxID=49181 RepID=UPI002B8DF409|nr:sigma-70 family RNA polymerase sigma factor [Zoogloea sp.]HMV18897.1 sigma-70 family RNA polymerase sigma factor [Rhodocyclaceae bacterium]HMV62264.1 sigma-70 family RNA polymerase sigma factor [Rhodocyclaceae bacterium]HMW50741.1 sigma-70 family RNA polymerase sigma factor [Rhodocyclaceae bacterium]HMY51174.1 sigma-70 family RNA polymerase sigma factor [Rhodocyclaceae bacterium]HMZ76001.1 sigma-70 family RNA polymerase sigma factor [Rhodocyclaceae bacterium]